LGAAVTATAKLELRNLCKRFPGNGRIDDLEALGGIDLHVEAGEFVSIIGTSGCGKSTLLRIVAGLEQATSGQVLVEGDPVLGPGPDRGMVFQGYSLFPWLSVAGNVRAGLKLAGVPKGEREGRVDELLQVMNLSERGGRLPRELSGGMRQRVAIARALAPEADLVLLDEPFGSLDAQTRGSMHEFLHQVWQRTGATIVLVTHDVDEAVYLSQRVYVMHARPGRIVEEIDLPFGIGLGPAVKRTAAFLDVRDEVHDLLLDVSPA
jgi:ABC-type nitrate/sulfonate/bicarbonate transport system ATPase subunit